MGALLELFGTFLLRRVPERPRWLLRLVMTVYVVLLVAAVVFAVDALT